MRLAALLKERCNSKICGLECIKYCPVVRSGKEAVVLVADKPSISEELCVGCGICTHKCPFEAIKIINLPEELKEELVHQYGRNEFRLFRLPSIKEGKVIALLGPNGIGKTTALNILCGDLVPNLGNCYKPAEWQHCLKKFAGTELYNYLSKLATKKITASIKPQYVDKLLDTCTNKKVIELLESSNPSKEHLNFVVQQLELEDLKERYLATLAGGELQRVAIANTILKSADIYFFDEPSSYLDVYQRLKVARIIKVLAERKKVVVVEHDLAVLDFLADEICLLYGSEGAYGIVAQPKTARVAINDYLEGYLKEENVRFRDWKIEFATKPAIRRWPSGVFFEYGALVKSYEKFVLRVSEGKVHKGEVVGIVGPNATGKTTFMELLAGKLKPSEGKIDLALAISYKPQYINLKGDAKVKELLTEKTAEASLLVELERGLSLKSLYNKSVNALSGGELQRVAIALALAQEADIYLIDEPSAYLDSSQRMEAAKTIRKMMEQRGKSAMIVDHDVYLIDLVADSLVVFSGIPAKEGFAQGPFDMRTGMNLFLKSLDITFRRDADSNRPRINKPESRLDREQKEKGEYYYIT
ncbi:MAG: ribosome biogenesis/translation initiation ATPase RLI [Candidatus Thermoplasmatota archaeon]|nr:ribosome biogenesis/translation initiation ATPase RLI [Candidatus Thermoplasmatota archaeon]